MRSPRSALLVLLSAVTLLGASAAPALGRKPAPTPPPAPVIDPADPPFDVLPFELGSLAWEELYPTLRALPPVTAPPPRDDDGVPMAWKAGARRYTRTGIAIEGLRRLQAYALTGDVAYLEMVRVYAGRLREMMVERDGALWLPIPWDDPGHRLRSPWYNALTQGTALAFYARLYRMTGLPTYLAVADGLFASFLDLERGQRRWTAHVVDGRLWLEHYPGSQRLAVLNAHLYAALGLRDYWEVTRDELAATMTRGAMATVRETAQQYRRPGSYSWYNLLGQRVAIPRYHVFHVRLLRAMAVASGDPWFARLAERFHRDYPHREVDVAGPAEWHGPVLWRAW